MTDQEKIYLLALHRLPQIGDATSKKLIELLGSAEAVFKEKTTHLESIHGLGLKRIQAINNECDLDSAERELQFIEDNGIEFLYFKDNAYPPKLKYCIDSPIVLFQRGNIDYTNRPIISIVGTRKITTQGIQFTKQLISDLKVFNPIIVSGFAYGTDITAHKQAIEENLQTIGCLAHGLNQIYPKVHSKYVKAIEANGGFVTDFCSDTEFDRNNFLKRNRIIAGLSEATIVIESAEKGGSLVTADIANSYNREVFALPGRYSDKMSIGCNNLIKKQQAVMLTCPADVPYILGWELENKPKKTIQFDMFTELDPVEKTIIEFLKEHHKVELDVIAMGCSMPTHKLTPLLLQLELKGILRPLPGKQFELM